MRIVDVRTYLAPPSKSGWVDRIRVSTPMIVHPEHAQPGSYWRGPTARELYVLVDTDEGITGVGMSRGGAVVQALIDAHLRELLIGKDPRNVERLWDQMFRATLAYGRKGVAIMALSALDLALWDILAKWMGQPLYRVLGGAAHEALPVYATHPEAHKLGFQRFTGVKIPLSYGPADGREGFARNVEKIAEVRDTVGPDIDIMVDCWMSWDVPYTLAFARAVKSCELRWIEEPLPPDDYDGYAELRRGIRGVQIAAGEHEYTRWGFREMIERGCVDILQPDLAWAGGLTEVRRIAAMASAHNLPVVPHNGGVQPWAIHLMMATPNCPLAEYLGPMGADTPAPPLLIGVPKHADRRIRAAETPGAGIAFDLAEWQRQTEPA